MPSLCDKCYAPGACCKFLYLNLQEAGGGPWMTEVSHEAVADIDRQLDLNVLPFEFIGWVWLHKYDGEPLRGVPMFNCPQLLPNGRCGIYEDRPALCRNFEEGSEPLCVHYNGEAGDPTVPIDGPYNPREMHLFPVGKLDRAEEVISPWPSLKKQEDIE
jgi:Fe-S-cluster containining protein